MKILLVAVNAKYIHTNLAVYSLRAYTNEYKRNVVIAEFTINHYAEDILKEIYKEQADVIAFSCYIWNIDIIIQVMEELRKVQPKVKIWFGGPEVSYDSRECLIKHKELDGIMIGEGEKTFLELLQYYIGENKELEQIPGLAYKLSAKRTAVEADEPYHLPDLNDTKAINIDAINYLNVTNDTDDLNVSNDTDDLNVLNDSKAINNITITPVRQPLSLDEIPFPYEDMEIFKNKIIYYESSRGCPFSCSYCLSSIDKRVRLRSVTLVKEELKIFLDYKVPQVKFVDRTFNCNKIHANEIWKFLKENDNGVTNFHFEISADLLDEEELKLLGSLRPGQIQLEIGVQSTNPETITAIHRKMDLNRLAKNVMKVHESKNIHQHLDLIAGLPYEGIDSFAKSFHDVYLLKPDQLQLGFLKVLKGSLMEEEVQAYGIVHQNNPPYEVLFTKYLSYSEVLTIKGVCEMVEVYYNSGQFQYAIRFLEHFFPFSFYLYQEIFQFYEKNGLNQAGHSRMKRYEILLDFYEELMLKLNLLKIKNDLSAVFKEILIVDLYLREDLRSRPSFAQNQNNQKSSREEYEHYELHKKNAHIEHFSYDIFASCETGQPVKEDLTIIFDYSNRDPLNNSAKIMIHKDKC